MIQSRLIFIAILAVIGFIFGSYMLGVRDGKQIQASKSLVLYKEEVQKNANIDKQVNRLADPDIDRALTRWMR